MPQENPGKLTSFGSKELGRPPPSESNSSGSLAISGFFQKVFNVLSPSPSTTENNDLQIEQRQRVSSSGSSSIESRHSTRAKSSVTMASGAMAKKPTTRTATATVGFILPPSGQSSTGNNTPEEPLTPVRKKKFKKSSSRKRRNSLGLIVVGFDDDFIRELKGKPCDNDNSDENDHEHDDDYSIHINDDLGSRKGSISNVGTGMILPDVNIRQQLTLPSLQALVRKLGKFGHEDDVRKDHWVRDEISTECYQCRLPFTTFRRKHHCRICGHVFCKKCASIMMPGQILGTDVDIRVCDYCAKIVYEYHGLPNVNDDFSSGIGTSELTFSSNTYHNAQTSIHSYQNFNSPSIAASTPLNDTVISNESPAQTSNSFENIRRFFSFSTRLWPAGNSSMASSSSAISESDLKTVANGDSLPFRKNVLDEEHSPILSMITETEDTNLVEFFSQNIIPVPASSILPNTPSLNSNQIEHQLTGEESSSDTTVQIYYKKRPSAFSSSKYSANALRSQLNIFTGLNDDSSSNTDSSLNPASERKKSFSDPTLNEVNHLETVNNKFMELDSNTMDFLNKLLKQLLKEQNISSNGWEKVLIHLSIQAVQHLRPKVKKGDNIDIRKYVKIKKLLVESHLSESVYVQGIVISKNVMHKSMVRTVVNPRILLLAFPLEYYRTDSQYMSLAPALSQEKEHLKNLVDRIRALRPEIVVVQNFVSRVALEFLLAANIIVVSNVKPAILEYVSRGTGAEIIASMDRITLKTDAQLGTCKKFFTKNISFQKNNVNYSKTLMYFDGCDPEKFCTILLKNNDLWELEKVKIICHAIVSVISNLKMETFLFKDMYARSPRSNNSQDCNEKVVEFHDHDSILARFRYPYISIILSFSPMVDFDPPYLIETMCNYEKKLLECRRDLLSKKDHLNSGETKTLQNTTTELDNIKVATLEFIHKLILKQSELVAPAYLPLEIRRGFGYVIEHANYNLSPLNHQNLMVLYCNVNILTSMTCHPPTIYNIGFYQMTDMTIGQYLEELCFDSNYLCPAETCQRPMMLHFRSYVHYNARLNVLIEEFPCPIPGLEATILTWSLCKVCNTVSPVIPISEVSWNYSFGKFLELYFYHSNLVCRSEFCDHKLNRDHVRYFGLKNISVRFEYEIIDIFEIDAPPLQVKHDHTILKTLKDRDMDKLRQEIANFYQSLIDRIHSFNLEEIEFMKLTDIQKELANMTKRIPTEKAAMLQLLQEKYLSSNDTEWLPLNNVRKVLYDNCREWDNLFAELIRNYVIPSDKRTTFGSGLGMRKLFQDRDSGKRPTIENTNSNAVFGANQALEQIALDMPSILSSTNGLDKWISAAHELEYFDDTLLPHLGPRLRSITTMVDTNDKSSQNAIVSALENDIQSAERESLHVDDPGQRISRFSRESSSRNSARASSVISRPISERYRSPSRVSYRGASTANDEQMFSPQERRLYSLSDPHGSRYYDLHFDADNIKSDPFASADLKKILSINGDYDNDDRQENSMLIEEYEPFNDFQRLDCHDFPQLNSIVNSPSSDQFNSNEKSGESEQLHLKDEGLGAISSPNSYINKDDESQRSSLMKTIRDFTKWIQTTQGSSATANENLTSLVGGETSLLFEFIGFKPLAYPFDLSEHFIKDSDIVIRENEPTSIIAFALNSKHYRDEIVKMRTVIGKQAEDSKDQTDVEKEESKTMTADATGIESNTQAYDNENYDRMEDGNNDNHIPHNPENEEHQNIEKTLLKIAGTHIRYEFPADSTKCSCSVYFAEQFDAIRRFTGVEELYVQSLSRCLDWNTKGGQSGSLFFKTMDDRFFMKQLSKPEMDSFLRFAPAYFEYISQAFFHDLPTILVKWFGVYRIGYKSSETGKSRKIDVVVMENLFYNRSPSRIFDLKGSMRNRHVQSTGQQSEVLLDENLIQIIGESPLFIREHSKKILRASVWNDTLFLSKLNVMDYSLLVGIDDERKELIIGIVDFIRTFTWDKKLESWVKESGILGGGGKEPTIVSPRQYKSRFRESMERYFLMVPDKYCSISQ